MMMWLTSKAKEAHQHNNVARVRAINRTLYLASIEPGHSLKLAWNSGMAL